MGSSPQSQELHVLPCHMCMAGCTIVGIINRSQSHYYFKRYLGVFEAPLNVKFNLPHQLCWAKASLAGWLLSLAALLECQVRVNSMAHHYLAWSLPCLTPPLGFAEQITLLAFPVLPCTWTSLVLQLPWELQVKVSTVLSYDEPWDSLWPGTLAQIMGSACLGTLKHDAGMHCWGYP